MASRHLGPVPGLVGNAGGLPPRPDRRGRLLRHRLGVIPARGEEQPPVQRAGGGIGDRVHRHPDLAVADLA